ncbi:MAG: substrate-binding domain-containing protein, partial [Microbacterium sp.]
STTARLLDDGATGLILHCADEAHAAVLAELDARGLRVPEDVSVISVGATFDTTALPTPIDSIPLVPEDSCDLAVDLALQCLSADKPEPGVRLIPPTYSPAGSVAPPRLKSSGAAAD